MYKIIVDIAYNNKKEYNNYIAKLAKKGIEVKVIKEFGPGGNWPEVELKGNKQILEKIVCQLMDDKNYFNDFAIKIN
jgi:hypothetical protein